MKKKKEEAKYYRKERGWTRYQFQINTGARRYVLYSDVLYLFYEKPEPTEFNLMVMHLNGDSSELFYGLFKSQLSTF